MTIALIIGLGALLFVLSFLFYLYSERVMATETGMAMADAAAGGRESVAPDQVGSQEALVYFGAGERRVTIERTLYVTYPEQIFAGEAFGLDVVIKAPDVDEIPAGLPQQTIDAGGRLRFQATEPNPLLEVALHFDEKDFATRQDRIRQRLGPVGETRFAFALRPLRAVTAPIMVTVAYVTSVQQPEVVEKRVVVTKTVGENPPETTETITYTPARTLSVPVTVKTIRLLIRVTSLLGLAENQVRFLQKALAPLLAVVLLAVALATGRIGDLTEFVVLLLTVTANVVGVEIFPEIKQLFS